MSDSKKMVLVEWHDAKFFPGTYKEEIVKNHKMATFSSLGYLIAKDKATTVLAAECNDEKEYRDVTLIPTGSIISIKELREAKVGRMARNPLTPGPPLEGITSPVLESGGSPYREPNDES